MNVFKNAENKIKNSYIIIPIMLVFVLMFFVSCALMYEDYTTSKLGYEALPTRKANDWVIPLVALLPQLGQVGFGFVFMADTNKKWAAIIVGLLWVVDVFTDVFYKASGLAPVWILGATIETVTIYSIGSELMFATSIGMMAYMWKDCVKQVERMAKSVIGATNNNRGGSYSLPKDWNKRTNSQPQKSFTVQPRKPQYSVNNKPKGKPLGMPAPTMFPFTNNGSDDD